MRKLALGTPLKGHEMPWILKSLKDIELASNEQAAEASAATMAVTNPVDRRAMDTATITLPQLAELVGTLISDLRKGGPKRT